ncbi:MAG: hypothetical protein HFK09_04250 [Clostridia bacterium]|nr:hypothetical protein [Clostridia bacterium]
MNNEILLLKIHENLSKILKLLEGGKTNIAETESAACIGGYDPLDKKISRIFISIGISANLKGYQFLREAIKLTIVKPDIINNVTSELYPEIALKHGTTKSKVERAMRHAIEAAWNRGKIENINALFGMSVCNSYEKPTNSEFIALIADKLMLDAD